MNNIARLIIASVMTLFFAAGCSDETQAPAKSVKSAKLDVCSSIGPTAFIVREIGGDKVTSSNLIPQDKDVHSYIPTPKDVDKMQQAKLFFAVGLPLEEQILKRILASSKIPMINISEGVKRIALSEEDKDFEHHQHDGDAHQHSADEAQYLDVHIWMSPANNLIIAKNICKALQAADPANSAFYAANLNNFSEKLLALDEKLKQLLAPHKGKTFLVYHPAFGYFGKHYGLIQEAVETGGKSPSPKHLEKLINEAKKDNVKIIFVQPQFNEKYADIVAKAVGAKIVRIDPQLPDILENYSYIAAQLATALESETSKLKEN